MELFFKFKNDEYNLTPVVGQYNPLLNRSKCRDTICSSQNGIKLPWATMEPPWTTMGQFNYNNGGDKFHYKKSGGGSIHIY